MNGDSDIHIDTCGCCVLPLPQERYNRPGISSLSYRIGTHATFLAAMKAHLSNQYFERTSRIYPLQNLRTRSTDDLSIALLDAWATVADVLTFYQERIANEGYLRTATERRSVLELARSIGYELNPGVSASTYLAFAVDDTTQDAVTVPKGTKVQSMPAQGKLPQTFETMTDIEARAEWNTLRPRLTRPQELAIRHDTETGKDKLYLLGISIRLPPEIPGIPRDQLYPINAVLDPGQIEVKAIEIQQIYLKGIDNNIKAGDPLLLVGKRDRDIKTIQFIIKRIEVETELKRTRVDLEEQKTSLPQFIPPLLKFATARLGDFYFNQSQVKSVVGQSWRDRDLRAFLIMNRWNERDMLTNIASPPAPDLPPADQGVFAFRQRTGFFGHNAPRWETLPKPENTRGYNSDSKKNKDPYKNSWDGDNERTIWQNSQGAPYTDASVYLERSVPEILSGSWVIFEAADGTGRAYRVSTLSEVSLVDYGISAKATGLKLKQPDGTTDPDTSVAFKVRKTTAHVQSQRLELADLPIEEALEEVEKDNQGKIIKKGATSLMFDHMVLDLQVGQPLVLSGVQADAAGVIRREAIIIADIVHSGGYTTIQFRDRLQYRYDRKTVTLSGNVVYATHGETVREVLGSGDGSQANQQFVLKRPQLTYVPAPAPSGASSTLEVRVNDVLWQEVPSLYGLDARSQSYIVRIDNDARAAVMFGDGKSGALLPSGTGNVVATYRSGIGPDGEVDADSLTLLQTRPQGIREVTNPVPATGSAAPEILDKARINAPRTALTFERIVSLSDFGDFARSYAGIGKAQAQAVWNGEKHEVHITVAGSNGKTIDDRLRTNLIDAISKARDPVQQAEVADFIPLTFSLEAQILVDQHYQYEDVSRQVENALLEAFSFELRDFGQPVTAAEIVMIIQAVEGVIAADLNKLAKDADSDQSTAKPAMILTAHTARLVDGYIQMAELLLLNPAGVALKKMEDKP